MTARFAPKRTKKHLKYVIRTPLQVVCWWWRHHN